MIIAAVCVFTLWPPKEPLIPPRKPSGEPAGGVLEQPIR
jgi:hypothetical protein